MTKKSYQGLQTELDMIIEQLQSGDLDIDEAMKLYERGSVVLKELETYLKQAENKIKTIKLPKKA